MFWHKTKDVITLFHKASSPTSVRVATLLKQVSANASNSATEDQASDHSAQTKATRSEFELEIIENPPTEDQLQTILGYVPQQSISSLIKGAKTPSEALKKFRESADNFQRPVVVDWSNGQAQAGENESAILKMVNALPQK